MFDTLRATPVAPGAPSDRVLIPGEPEAAQHAYNLRHGIPLRREVLVELRDVCRDFNVPFELHAEGLDSIERIATKSDH
jgi:LDH2 family malate/lactate/ureidoglycolate dehydrogenase